MAFNRKSSHLRTGLCGERAAVLFLLLRGYRILERNYLCPAGEIDIVARKKDTIVFVEVRTRKVDALVDPVESIDNLKLAHVVDTASHFLSARGKRGSFCRFDIISVRSGGSLRDRIRHYPDAFRVTDERSVLGARLKSLYWRRPR